MARTWTADPAIQALIPKLRDHSNGLGQVAWFADTAHVALLLESRNAQNRRTQEIVIATKDGRIRGRHGVEAVLSLAATNDRLLVAASKLELLDLDGKVIAELARDRTAQRVSEGGGMFAAVIAPRGIKLIRPSDGVVLATWDVAAHDAVPVASGVVAVDADGTVRVGCLQGKAVHETATVASGVARAQIEHIGETIVLAGHDANPIHVATFANPCR